MGELEVHLVLDKCLQLFNAIESIFSELRVPLLVNFQWIISLLYTYPFFNLFLTIENAGACFIDFVLELLHNAL